VPNAPHNALSQHDHTFSSGRLDVNFTSGSTYSYHGFSETELLTWLNAAQAIMMRMIAETPDATVGYLAQRLYVTSQFVTIEIGNLVKKGIVEKRPNPAGRRSMFLSLTRTGKSLLCELAPIMRKGNDIHFRSLTEERVRLLQEMISILITDGMTSLREVYAPLLDGQMAPSARTARPVRCSRRSLSASRALARWRRS
jgi:DNA-binding MarR family transcriptional regulator